jgi:hypothetical protein
MQSGYKKSKHVYSEQSLQRVNGFYSLLFNYSAIYN